MKYNLIYAEAARNDLRALDRTIAQRIIGKIGHYLKQDKPLFFAKKLKPPFEKLYRFRIGEYRALFEVNSDGDITILIILQVKHRKDIYNL